MILIEDSIDSNHTACISLYEVHAFFLCAHALVEDLAHTDPADLTDFVVGGKSH